MLDRDPLAGSACTEDALLTTSLDGRVLGWSRGAQSLFGWREREILGRPLDDLLHEKHRAIDRQTVVDASAGHVVRDTVVKFVRRDAAVLSCLQTTVPLRDMGGRIHAVVRIVFDLTPLQDAERALRRMKLELDAVSGSAPTAPAESGATALAKSVRAERDRTRAQYQRSVASEARRIRVLADELAQRAVPGAASSGRALAV